MGDRGSAFLQSGFGESESAAEATAQETHILDVIKDDLAEAKKKHAKSEDTANLIRSQIAKPLTDEDVGLIKQKIDMDADVQTTTNAIEEIVGKNAPLYERYAAPAAKPGGGKTGDQTKDSAGTGDSVAYEDYKMQIVIGSLGTEPWLFVKNGDGAFVSPCREAATLGPIKPPTDYLGSAGGLEFWTNDRKKFSDLVLFVLGGIPNTVGSHVLGGAGSKAGTTQFLFLNGQPAAITQPKATARPQPGS